MQKLNITLTPDQNLYFTSDLHFGHRNILRFCARPFRDEKDMARGLISNWNATVRPNDVVFSLGDFSWWTGRHEVKRLVEQLQGEKYFIPGNHCKEGMYELVNDPQFHECSDIVHLYVRGEEGDPRFRDKKCYEIILCHYPLATASHIKSSYHFFGHIHSAVSEPLTEFGEPLKLPIGRVMDVGADRHHYKPVEFFEVLKEIEEYPFWDMH